MVADIIHATLEFAAGLALVGVALYYVGVLL